MKCLKKIVHSFESHGLCKSIFWLFFGYFRVNEFLVYRIDLDEMEGQVEDSSDELNLKLADREEIERIRIDPNFKTSEVHISSYLKVSDCFIGYIDGSPVHIMWVFRKGDDSRLFSLSATQAELNYCFTPDNCRGKGIYVRMIAKAIRRLKSEGIKSVYMATHITNIPAQKAISRAGLHHIGAIKNYGIFHRPKWSE